jgi:anti-sigma regulatory factor (Ser/Thr protein kinase)
MAVGLEEIRVEAGEHVAQFYENDAQLARTVGAYLTTALADGAIAIAIATEAHRQLFAAELEAAGIDPARSSREGRLILLDAAATMARFVDGERVDREGFRGIVGTVVEQAAESGRPVRAYGEMVALLWEAGDVLTAIELEKAWNELARELPFALLCAYRSESVQGQEHADALHEVCHLHTSVVGTAEGGERDFATGRDLCAHFSAEPQAATSARHFVADVLKGWGHSASMLEDAKLVVTELATNAVRHAHSPFSVEICPKGSVVRLSVRDASRTLPSLADRNALAESGRGLHIVDVLSADWGVEFSGQGKAVWAELRP